MSVVMGVLQVKIIGGSFWCIASGAGKSGFDLNDLTCGHCFPHIRTWNCLLVSQGI